MKNKSFEISQYSPCKEALEFRAKYKTFEEAWEACPRGDWMLWIAKRLNIDLLKLTTAKALCANTVRHLMKDERSINAVDVALKFGEGKATRIELDATYAHAAAAAYDDAANAAAYAANAAAYDAAAYAYATADAAANSAAAAAYTYAYAHAAADAYAAATDARIKNRLETADICRRILTKEVFKKLNIC
jgi:hypothetical protein